MSKYKCFIETPDGMVCKDHRLRSFVNFGTYSFCLKFWAKEGYARRMAEKLCLKEYTIIFVYAGDEIQSDGQVIRHYPEVINE